MDALNNNILPVCSIKHVTPLNDAAQTLLHSSRKQLSTFNFYIFVNLNGVLEPLKRVVIVAFDIKQTLYTELQIREGKGIEDN